MKILSSIVTTMSSLAILCNQCIPRLTTVQAGFEEECGWQDVFGQPYLIVPKGVWKMHTKREKQRVKAQMLGAILKELPKTNEARALAKRIASCFMRFTTLASDYTLGAMKKTMVQFLVNCAHFQEHHDALLMFSEKEYGDNVEPYKAEGNVPRIPIKFDKDTTLHLCSGATKQVSAHEVYDLYDMVHPVNPVQQVQSFTGQFSIQRDVMRFWWYARAEYERFVKDKEELCRLCADQELFDSLVQHGFYEGDIPEPPMKMIRDSFEVNHAQRTSASLMRGRILCFNSEEHGNGREGSSTVPTPTRPHKKRRVAQKKKDFFSL